MLAFSFLQSRPRRVRMADYRVRRATRIAPSPESSGSPSFDLTQARAASGVRPARNGRRGACEVQYRSSPLGQHVGLDTRGPSWSSVSSLPATKRVAGGPRRHDDRCSDAIGQGRRSIFNLVPGNQLLDRYRFLEMASRRARGLRDLPHPGRRTGKRLQRSAKCGLSHTAAPEAVAPQGLRSPGKDTRNRPSRQSSFMAVRLPC
jgi:hypothetical protein